MTSEIDKMLCGIFVPCRGLFPTYYDFVSFVIVIIFLTLAISVDWMRYEWEIEARYCIHIWNDVKNQQAYSIVKSTNADNFYIKKISRIYVHHIIQTQIASCMIDSNCSLVLLVICHQKFSFKHFVNGCGSRFKQFCNNNSAF